MNDIRYAFRQLLKNPAFTAVAVLTLALGIGANTAIYSVVNSVLLNPVPGREPDRLMQIAERIYDNHKKPFFVGVSPPALKAFRENQAFFADLAWSDGAWLERKTEDFVDLVPGTKVSPNFFTFLNAMPMFGRTFAEHEAKLGQDSVIILSHSLWQSVFGGDTHALGKAIGLGGRHYTVIGVMPPSFRFPWGNVKFWVPSEDPPNTMPAPNNRVYVRLKPSATVQQTQTMLDTVAQRLANDPSLERWYGREWRDRPGGLGFWVRPLRREFLEASEIVKDLQQTLFGLHGAIGFVLLIVCANVANLMLAKTETRQHELTIRAALGAGRLRLTRQLLTESVLLACLGGLGGLVVTVLGIQLLARLVPEYLPRLKGIQVEGHALGFTVLISVATGLVFGCAPAWQVGRSRLSDALKQAGSGASPGVGQKRYRSALVIGEAALTLVLLTGAGLMIQSVLRLLHVNPGFDPENLLRVHVNLPLQKYGMKLELKNTLLAQLHERVGTLPGVEMVGIGKDAAWDEECKIDRLEEPMRLYRAGCGVEQSDLFRAMRIPLRAGRYFGKSDIGDKIGTAIINETMARLCWPGENAVGKRFRQTRGDRTYEVVGVVGDAHLFRYDQSVKPTFYRPELEMDVIGQPLFLAVRTRGDPRSLIPAIRKELKAADPAMRPPTIVVARQALYDATQAQRTYMIYLVIFAGVGLALSALGIYGVLAYSVARRTREIGIRLAVGAERRHVLGMVIREGMLLVGGGVIVGLLAAVWLTRLLRSQLFEVSPTEPVVFAGVVLLLFAVAFLACFLPALRASRVDPMVALRYE